VVKQESPEDKPEDKTSFGRRTDEQMREVFEDVCVWLEESDGDLHTVIEIRDEMIKRVDNADDVYGVQHLKKLLQQRYGDSLWFASVLGRKDVVCFRNMATRIVSDKWYGERNKDATKDSERIVEAAAKLLVANIRETEYSNDEYPLLETVRDKAKAKKWVPPLLQKFLQCLIKDEVKQVALGHSIVQSCRPRSVVAPVLFGVGVSVDHVLGAEWLLKVLNTLGFSLSVDEVTRYKQSVVRAEGSDKTPIGRDVFSQWAGDNVDHNVKTLDGSQTFHGMGIISMSVGGHPDEYLEIPVKRLTRITVGNLVHIVKLLHYIVDGSQVTTMCYSVHPAF